MTHPTPYAPTPYPPVQAPPPSRAFKVWAHVLTWGSVGLTVAGVAVAAVFIAIATADGWSGDGLPSGPSTLGLVGYGILGILLVCSPVLLGALIGGIVMLVKARR